VFGLRLVPEKLPMEMIVIDQAEGRQRMKRRLLNRNFEVASIKPSTGNDIPRGDCLGVDSRPSRMTIGLGRCVLEGFYKFNKRFSILLMTGPGRSATLRNVHLEEGP